MLLPPYIKRLRACGRCGMSFAYRLTECPHCADLNERELVDFLARRGEELAGIAGLGRLFLMLAVIFLALSILAWHL